ncbi:mitochondrial inner membrane protease subunit 2 isoform X5 [Carcharodon carcharias]|uniref:mitochondrial inner membrane protease subunit 2 isoform X5 n=1 Tax=Carcharodon carcharias TaxID=13397 RepID=UPI001B7DDCC2|nr:mitochondrial inner membrane protease subunit 2 isoform X5 [Carcharodon carcharias]
MELAPLGLIMARAAGFGKRYLKAFVSGFFVAVPVTVTFLDRVAYIARVEGASMQPSLNPPGRTTCDIVLLNRWSVRNYEVQRGDIVSLVQHSDQTNGLEVYGKVVEVNPVTQKPRTENNQASDCP